MIEKKSSHLIWIDLEMTGLHPEHDRIIEMATIVTDKQLEILGEGPVFAIHQSDALLEGMDEWNTECHNRTGLVDRVKQSSVSEAQAEEETLAFLSQYAPEGKIPMCGNSVYQDRRFLRRYMPGLEKFFHYRNVDVSTLKELGKRWAQKEIKKYKKKTKHTALSDIRDSVEELKFYRAHLFRDDLK